MGSNLRMRNEQIYLLKTNLQPKEWNWTIKKFAPVTVEGEIGAQLQQEVIEVGTENWKHVNPLCCR